MNFKNLVRKIKFCILPSYKNIYKSNFKRKVLISYISDGIKKPSFAHPNSFEVKVAADVFDSLGYKVDLVRYDVILRNTKKYDIIFGFGETVEHFYKSQFNNGTKVILYLTGMHPYFSNAETLKRIRNIYKNNGKYFINSARVIDFSWNRQLMLADSVVTLGNDFSVEICKKYYDGDVWQLNTPFHQVVDYKEILNSKSNSAKTSFLWFGSCGVVHKGLDLCLEFFKSRPDLTLHVCGPIELEVDFLDSYFDILYSTPNIKTHGFVDIMSPRFTEILRSVYYLIFPSCSEGGASSVLTAIGNGGMLPIMTKATAIDIPYVVYIDHLTVDSIRVAVEKSLTLDQKTLQERAFSNAAYISAMHSTAKYSTNLYKTIKNIIERF